jgi:UDP-GlcNAc3NAcA epimerase
VHRAENTDNPALLDSILEGLRLVSEDIPVILPLHPRTRAKIDPNALPRFASDRFQIIDPVGYLDMIMLEKHAALVATDSGGVQKEAYFYEVPCVTLRSETEWVELIDSGWNRLVTPGSSATIRKEIKDALSCRGRQMKLYGAGDAARRMVSALLRTQESSTTKVSRSQTAALNSR